jgi:hypothetical protein
MLRQKLLEIWSGHRGSVVLFLWHSLLREETLQLLGVEERLDISEMVGAAVKKLNLARKEKFLQKLSRSPPILSNFREDNVVIIDEDDKEVVSQENLDQPRPVAAFVNGSLPRSTSPPDMNFKFGGDLRRRRQQQEEEDRLVEVLRREDLRKKEQQRLKKFRKERKSSSREEVPCGSEEYWDKEDKTAKHEPTKTGD